QCNVINSEINKYKNKEDNFGTPWAVKGCEEFKDDYDPDDDDMADIRELRDEDFISDAEEEDFAGTNLESDEDQVPNMYGEEEYDN
ncbi:hypothetical protein IGI04_006974, partial [Brassica rapa subsp. trilocularis]